MEEIVSFRALPEIASSTTLRSPFRVFRVFRGSNSFFVPFVGFCDDSCDSWTLCVLCASLGRRSPYYENACERLSFDFYAITRSFQFILLLQVRHAQVYLVGGDVFIGSRIGQRQHVLHGKHPAIYA